MHDYDNDTAIDLMDSQAYLFMIIPSEVVDADVKQLITIWMKSKTREALDDGSPAFLYRSGSELLSWFLNQEIKGEYPKGTSDYQPHVLHWVGLIYQLYAYKEKISSAELISILSLDTLYDMYYPWHELSDLGAVKRIKRYLQEIG